MKVSSYSIKKDLKILKEVHCRQKLTTVFFKFFELTILVVTISISRKNDMFTMVSGGSFCKGLDNKS